VKPHRPTRHVLPPIVVYRPLHLTQEERVAILDGVAARADMLFSEAPLRFPRLAEFDPGTSQDRFARFMVEVRQKAKPDERYMALAPAELQRVRELQRDGYLLFFSVSPLDSDDWVGWLYFRAPDRASVQMLLESLPLYDFLTFHVREAARV